MLIYIFFGFLMLCRQIIRSLSRCSRTSCMYMSEDIGIFVHLPFQTLTTARVSTFSSTLTRRFALRDGKACMEHEGWEIVALAAVDHGAGLLDRGRRRDGSMPTSSS